MNQVNDDSKQKKRTGAKRHDKWTVGDRVIYMKTDECLILDILFDSYPPRALIRRMRDSQQMVTEFSNLQQIGSTISVDTVHEEAVRKAYPFNDREKQIS